MEKSKYNQKLILPIESYANSLAFICKYYLDIVENELSDAHKNDAKIRLQWLIYVNKTLESVGGYDNNAVGHHVRKYLQCVMTKLGEIAECAIINKCSNDKTFNRICINVALYKDNIYSFYDIPYDEYIAFSSSFKFVIYERDGVLQRQPIMEEYNPKHTSKDIGWFHKDFIANQLKTEIKQLKYSNNAKLQIKTTTDCERLDLRSYIFTPIVVFDLDNNIQTLKNRFPNHIIFSARELDLNIEQEIEQYFKILVAYASGMIDHINIEEKNLIEDKTLGELFASPTSQLLSQERIMIDGIIKMVQQNMKPTEIAV